MIFSEKLNRRVFVMNHAKHLPYILTHTHTHTHTHKYVCVLVQSCYKGGDSDVIRYLLGHVATQCGAFSYFVVSGGSCLALWSSC